MSEDLSLYIVCYDISSDSTRTALANDLLDFGAREQNSVFEVTVTRDRYETLLQILKSVELGKDDSIAVYPVYKDAVAGIVRFGKQPPPAQDVLVF
ncbi:MAG: CRISPR-associated endonuclease Cas2 [bacterium]|jgi:CRISPR-associated endonuclease Cas2